MKKIEVQCSYCGHREYITDEIVIPICRACLEEMEVVDGQSNK